MTANTFALQQNTASKICTSVCEAVSEIFRLLLIKLPRHFQKISDFEIPFGIAKAFGFIDRTQINMLLTDSQGYFNYNQLFFSKCKSNL